jgi:hypothetical protein
MTTGIELGDPRRPGGAPPAKGMRAAVGLILLMPQHTAGMRLEPATSVATPITLPFMARRAPSPPVDPPAVRERLCGFSVRPKMLF